MPVTLTGRCPSIMQMQSTLSDNRREQQLAMGLNAGKLTAPASPRTAVSALCSWIGKKHIVCKAVRVSPLLFCFCVAISQGSWATLGGARDTVQTDEVHMRATRRVANHTGYEVHDLTLDSGTVVREFVSPSGTVFAVAWQGPFKPDLNKLLGEYFPRLVAAGRQPHGDHRMLSVHAADLVIDSGGKMRGFAGRAYLPALVPAMVSIADIR